MQLLNITLLKKKASQELKKVRMMRRRTKHTPGHELSMADQLHNQSLLLAPAPDLLLHPNEEASQL